jgi:cell division protein FtsW (lipid II flippase)
MHPAGRAPLLLGALAVAAGAGFLWTAGALPGMVSRNVAAFLLGLLLGWPLHRAAHWRHGAAILFSLACGVLGLVLVAGFTLDGVTRWLDFGPVRLQPALVLAPLLLALAGSREGRHWRIAILLPMMLVALQPDAATLAGLAIGTIAMMATASGRSRRGWSHRRMAVAAGAALVAALGLLVAGIQTPPPVAFVEGTVTIAYLSGLIAILLHFAALALVVAALLSRLGAAEAALAAYFVTAIVAAFFWAFPMPVVGAAPSHLIGFGLAIGWLAEGRRRLARA